MKTQLDGGHAANDCFCFSVCQSIKAIERIKAQEPEEEMPMPYEHDRKILGMIGAATVLTAIAYIGWSML